MAQISFGIPTALSIAGATTLQATTNALLRADSNGLVHTTALQSNLSLASGTLSLAAALTSITSITAGSATSLTLSGGSSGASLVLGQGTNGAVTLTTQGTGLFTLANDAAWLRLGTVTGAKTYYISGVQAGGAIQIQQNSGSTSRWIAFGKVDNTFVWTEQARIGDSGNLLIGTTTDASSLAGGLVISGSGSGATASSTTTGAVRVTGGVGVSGSIYVGSGVGIGTDILLTRTAANQLNGTTSYGAEKSTSGSLAFFAYVTGDTQTRWQVAASGVMEWGAGGASVRDTFLSRSAAGTLSVTATTASTSTTSGALVVSGGVGIAGAAYFGVGLSDSGRAINFSAASGRPVLQLLSNTNSNATSYAHFLNSSTSATITSARTQEIRFGYTAEDGSTATVVQIESQLTATGATSSSLAGAFAIKLGGSAVQVASFAPTGLTLGSASSSITGATTTSLTLAGGSSGASLVLGQGSSGSVTITPAGGGSISSTSNTFIGLNLIRGTEATGGRGIQLTNGAGNYWAIGALGSASNSLSFGYNTTALPTATGMTLTSGANLLIGGATDAISTARLQVYGSSAAGIAYVHLVNNVTADTANRMRLTLAPSSGFAASPVLAPYIEGITLASATQRAGIGFGVYEPTGSASAAVEVMRITSVASGTGNVLIGGTTDISGSGGLKVFGTTAATSTTSGAFQCAGGAGVAGALYVGGGSTITLTTSTTSGSALLVQTDGSGAATTDIFGADLRVRSGHSSGTQTNFIAVRALARGNNASLITNAVAFHAQVDNPGAATISNAIGFQASDISVGTNVYGFRGSISSGSNKYNLYLDGTAANLLAGATTISNVTASTSTTSGALIVSGGVGIVGALYNGGGIVTSGVLRVQTGNGTAAYLSLLQSAQQEWRVESIASSTNLRIRAQDAGVDVLTLSTTGNATLIGDLTVTGGNIGLGVAAGAANGIDIQTSLSVSAAQWGILSRATFSSAATTSGAAIYGKVTTAAASFTMAAGYGILMESPTLGAGSAITDSYGIRINNQGVSGITNVFGIDIAAQSGGATTNVGFRNAGTTLLTNTTASTSTTSGALVVSGGVGVAGNVNAGGIAHTFGAATGQTAVWVSGGAGSYRLLYFSTGLGGTDANRRWAIAANISAESGSNTGSDLEFRAYSDAGAPLSGGIAMSIARATGVVSVLSTSAASSTTTGAFRVSGGVGIAGALYTGDDIEVANTAAGVILRSPSGSRYRVTVANDGALTTTAL